jgi:hypothetical protein
MEDIEQLGRWDDSTRVSPWFPPCFSNGPVDQIAMVTMMEDLHRFNSLDFSFIKANQSTVIYECLTYHTDIP